MHVFSIEDCMHPSRIVRLRPFGQADSCCVAYPIPMMFHMGCMFQCIAMNRILGGKALGARIVATRSYFIMYTE
jgi:hypothetical protein